MVCKAKNIYYLDLDRKCLLIPKLDCYEMLANQDGKMICSI